MRRLKIAEMRPKMAKMKPTIAKMRFKKNCHLGQIPVAFDIYIYIFVKTLFV